MANIVALLDSMWGWGGHNKAGEEAPRYFRINPNNHSGRRLYSLVGDHKLLVTNCCKTVQASANHHGTPDLDWILKNLFDLTDNGMKVLLVCGRVAQEAFAEMSDKFPFAAEYIRSVNILRIDHPAARRWSKATIESTRQEIAALCRENSTNSN